MNDGKEWRCGDCGRIYPPTVTSCTRPYDDYLAVHGGSVLSAVLLAAFMATGHTLRLAEARVDVSVDRANRRGLTPFRGIGYTSVYTRS